MCASDCQATWSLCEISVWVTHLNRLLQYFLGPSSHSKTKIWPFIKERWGKGKHRNRIAGRSFEFTSKLVCEQLGSMWSSDPSVFVCWTMCTLCKLHCSKSLSNQSASWRCCSLYQSHNLYYCVQSSIHLRIYFLLYFVTTVLICHHFEQVRIPKL